MVTGLTTATFDNLQLNAGVLLKNFNHESAKTAAALKTLLATAVKNPEMCLGATRGGGTFTATPTTREVEADGMRSAFVGSTHIDSWNIQLTSTLLEVTGANLKLALGAADADESNVVGEGVTTITLKTDFESDDYIDSICWVGDTSKGFVMIELENALSVGGMNFTFTDKNEGTIPITLTAHQASLDDSDKVPVKIYLFS